MREIKFRAWDKEKQIMFCIYDSAKRKDWFLPAVWDRYEIMQYTGLKDKNGVEIYEGDIVLYKYASYKDISRILYHEEVASFVMEAIKEDDNRSMAKFIKGRIRGFEEGRVNGYDYVKVIGNIWEHPELITQKEGKV